MTLRHFRIFLCVYDEGNMTAAARKLHIAQPSISQAISELEKYYDVRLFERLNHKLFITTAGQKLLTYARHIVSLNLEAEVAMKEAGNKSQLKVGASVTVGTCIFTDIIRTFSSNNPNVKLNTWVNNTKVIEEMLLMDQLDIGLVEGKIHSQSLFTKAFIEDELVLVCAPVHSLGQKSIVKPFELNDVEFIVREEGSGTRELFETIMASNDISWQIAGVYNNAEAIKNMIAAGLGITVISKMAVQKELEKKELVIIKIEGIHFKRQFSIVYHKNKYISPTLDKFINSCSCFNKNCC